jgi:hypothetical protein
MAGVTDELEVEDAVGIASFLVAMGRVPAPAQWVDAILKESEANAMEGFF